MNKENHRRLEKYNSLILNNIMLFENVIAEYKGKYSVPSFNYANQLHQQIVNKIRVMYSLKTASCDIFRTCMFRYLNLVK